MRKEDYDEAVSLLAAACTESLGDEASEDDVENWVHDNWEDILPERLVAYIYAKVDYESVVHANMLGGGGWEVLRGLEIDVKDKLEGFYNY